MKFKLHKPVPFRIHHRNNDMPQFQVVILSYCTAYADLGAGAAGNLVNFTLAVGQAGQELQVLAWMFQLWPQSGRTNCQVDSIGCCNQAAGDTVAPFCPETEQVTIRNS